MFCLGIYSFMPYLVMHYRPADWPAAYFLLFTPIIAVVLALIFIGSYSTLKQEFQDAIRSFHVYGQVQHAVPRVSVGSSLYCLDISSITDS